MAAITCGRGCTCGKHVRRSQATAPRCPDCDWVGTVSAAPRARSNELRWHRGLGRDFATARAVPLCENIRGYAPMTNEEIHTKWPITCATADELHHAMTDAVLDKILDVMTGISTRFPYRPPRGLRNVA